MPSLSHTPSTEGALRSLNPPQCNNVTNNHDEQESNDSQRITSVPGLPSFRPSYPVNELATAVTNDGMTISRGVRGVAIVRNIRSFGYNDDEQIHQLDNARNDATLDADDRDVISEAIAAASEQREAVAARDAAQVGCEIATLGLQVQMLQVDLARIRLEQARSTARGATIDAMTSSAPQTGELVISIFPQRSQRRRASQARRLIRTSVVRGQRARSVPPPTGLPSIPPPRTTQSEPPLGNVSANQSSNTERASRRGYHNDFPLELFSAERCHEKTPVLSHLMRFPTLHNKALYQARQARAQASLDTAEIDEELAYRILRYPAMWATIGRVMDHQWGIERALIYYALNEQEDDEIDMGVRRARRWSFSPRPGSTQNPSGRI